MTDPELSSGDVPDDPLVQEALVRRWIGKKQLEGIRQAIRQASSEGKPPDVLGILVANGYLTPAQANALKASGTSTTRLHLGAAPVRVEDLGWSREEEALVRECLRRRWIAPKELEPIRRTQQELAAKGYPMGFLEVAASRGALTNAQVAALKNAGRGDTIATFGPYRILSTIGEGAVGAVYLAEREDAPGRLRALKILSPNSCKDEELNARFRREGELLRSIQHPHIVRAYETGELQGRLYILMEYVDGKSLGDLIQEKGALEEKMVLQVGLQIADALICISRKGIVHRDIKPDNIMIDGNGSSRLMDMGYATPIGKGLPELGRAGMTYGTPLYMSPENLRGEPLDVRNDIYSLGGTLFHALTGSPPYPSRGIETAIRKGLGESVPDARALRRQISEPVSLLLKVMLAKNRAERHQTAAELLADLRRVVRGLPPGRKPVPPKG